MLRINIRDHPPPHFHVILSDGRERVRIDTLQIMHGNVATREISEARAWARANRETLALKFEELQR